MKITGLFCLLSFAMTSAFAEPADVSGMSYAVTVESSDDTVIEDCWVFNDDGSFFAVKGIDGTWIQRSFGPWTVWRTDTTREFPHTEVKWLGIQRAQFLRGKGISEAGGLTYRVSGTESDCGSGLVFSDVQDLAGNGVLSYNSWGSFYPYADGFCRIVEACEAAVHVETVADGLYSCRCDDFWGCSGESCTNAFGSWSRFAEVICAGCR